MLAAAAIRGDEPTGADLGDPGAAARARLAALVVDGQEIADLALEGRGHPFAQDGDRIGQGGPRRRVQRVDFLGRQRRALAERQELRGVEDLVAVGIADAGDEGLVAEQVLELARMVPDPLPPDLEGQGRVVGVRSLVRRRRGRARPARRRPAR